MATTKYDFRIPLLDGEGEEVKDGKNKPLLLSALLGAQLMNSTTQEPAKYFDWGLDLFNKNPGGGVLDLDKVDGELLIKFINECPTLTTLGKGRLLQVLKDKPEPKNKTK